MQATNHGLNRLEEIPVSVRLLKALHTILLTDVRGSDQQIGDLRTSQNWIGPQGCSAVALAFVGVLLRP